MRSSKSLRTAARGILPAVTAGAVLSNFIFAAHAAQSDFRPPVYEKKYVMGTVFEIVAYGGPSTHTARAIDEAFDEIIRLDRVMSNYKSDSDLSRLNRTAHFHAEAVPEDLYRVIEESLRYSELSGGEFDITVGRLVDRWKAAIHGEPAPSPAEEAKLRSCAGYRQIELIPPNRIEFHSPCLEVDLGAIGKGYAVDRAEAVLRSHGIERALINAGASTLYAMGPPPRQSGWLVHLRDPSGRIHPEVILREDSVSTSEQTRPSLVGEGPFGHIIDPSTGMPLKTSFAVSVVAKTATDSDALSTTLLLLGPDKGRALVNRLSGVAAVWISPDGETETAANGPEITTGDSASGTRGDRQP